MTFTREFARELTEKRPAQSTFFASGIQLQIHTLPQICYPSSLACLLIFKLYRSKLRKIDWKIRK